MKSVNADILASTCTGAPEALRKRAKLWLRLCCMRRRASLAIVHVHHFWPGPQPCTWYLLADEVWTPDGAGFDRLGDDFRLPLHWSGSL